MILISKTLNNIFNYKFELLVKNNNFQFKILKFNFKLKFNIKLKINFKLKNTFRLINYFLFFKIYLLMSLGNGVVFCLP